MKHPPQFNVESRHMFLEKNWVLIVGVLLGAMTLFFLMILAIMSTLQMTVPEGSKFIVITIIAFGLSFSGAFIGGNAAAKGKLPFISEKYTAEFSAGGGVATFLIVFVLGSYFYKDMAIPPEVPWDGKMVSLKKVEAKISNVDDIMIVKVNDKQVAEVNYGEVPPGFDILTELKRGQNIIEVTVKNGTYGGCSGKLTLVFNTMAIPDYQWSVSNPFAAPDSICYTQKKILKID